MNDSNNSSIMGGNQAKAQLDNDISAIEKEHGATSFKTQEDMIGDDLLKLIDSHSSHSQDEEISFENSSNPKDSPILAGQSSLFAKSLNKDIKQQTSQSLFKTQSLGNKNCNGQQNAIYSPHQRLGQMTQNQGLFMAVDQPMHP